MLLGSEMSVGNNVGTCLIQTSVGCFTEDQLRLLPPFSLLVESLYFIVLHSSNPSLFTLERSKKKQVKLDEGV